MSPLPGRSTYHVGAEIGQALGGQRAGDDAVVNDAEASERAVGKGMGHRGYQMRLEE